MLAIKAMTFVALRRLEDAEKQIKLVEDKIEKKPNLANNYIVEGLLTVKGMHAMQKGETSKAEDYFLQALDKAK